MSNETMPLDHLHERYSQFAKLSESHLHLFWTLTSSSSDKNEETKSSPLSLDTFRFALAYLLPKPLHEQNISTYNEPKMQYWLGFGFSPQGGMVGADMMVYLPSSPNELRSNSSSSAGRLLDVYGVEYSFPHVDKCGQDWELVNSSILPSIHDGVNAWHVVEATRPLQSNDINEDIPIFNDTSKLINPTHVVAAWGRLNLDGTEDEINGRLLRTTNMTDEPLSQEIKYLDLTSMIVPHTPSARVSATVRLFETPLGDNGASSGSGSADELSNNLEGMPFIDLIPDELFQIPNEETTYTNFCFQLEDYPELMNDLSEKDSVHIIAFHDIVGGLLVHHMDLHGTANEVLAADKRLCRVYMDLMHPWEAGSPRTFELPEEAGIPLGKDGYQAFRVEVHYHNPGRQSGLLDRSGVRLYYSEKRPHVAGLMLLGDYMLKLRGSYTVGGSVSRNSSKTNNAAGMRHSFYCPPPCFSKNRLGIGTNNSTTSSNSVTVFREVLHMHKSGKRMVNIHFDANGDISRASEANRFDFSKGAGYASRIDLPYQISEGDSFLTTCYFSTKDVVWGSSSGQEMCQSFLWYYPILKAGSSLTCGYFDAMAQRPIGSNLESAGCEMSYDRAEVPIETDLDRLQAGEECQAAELSQRRFHAIDFWTVTKNLHSWPSLSRLVNTWKQGTGSATTELVNVTTSGSKEIKRPQATVSTSTLDEECRLCPNGQRPTRPAEIVKGFSWTCDELDAAIPVLYTRPELLYFSLDEIPPCEKYYSSFGELCGCPGTNVTNHAASSERTDMLVKNGMFGFLILLALVLLF